MKRLFLCLLIMLAAGCGTVKGSGYYAIDHFYFKEEGDAFRTAFSKTQTDLYRWYQDIEGEDGVYILHSDYFDTSLLDGWRADKIYSSVPESAFWYFAVSENYLRDRGFVLEEEDLAKIRDGVRLYLLPDTMTAEEAGVMKEFLTEDALYGIDEDSLIPTVFEKEKKIEFKTCHFDATLETEEQGEIRDPVIYVCSSANMKYFESESLIATGKRDSYIKLTEEAFRKYAEKDLPEELKERKLTFLPLERISN